VEANFRSGGGEFDDLKRSPLGRGNGATGGRRLTALWSPACAVRPWSSTDRGGFLAARRVRCPTDRYASGLEIVGPRATAISVSGPPAMVLIPGRLFTGSGAAISWGNFERTPPGVEGPPIDAAHPTIEDCR
jgi:hypothetical protein